MQYLLTEEEYKNLDTGVENFEIRVAEEVEKRLAISRDKVRCILQGLAKEYGWRDTYGMGQFNGLRDLNQRLAAACSIEPKDLA
jgi:hypothetical protein